ncbi:MAG: acyltransferase [Ignavibacteriae bacterium]|nr:acyltransferase [Ignavibacteriota bacterium]
MLLNKFINSLKNRPKVFTFKKVLLWFYRIFSIKILSRIKTWLYFNSKDLALGSNVKISGLCSDIKIGINNNFYDQCRFHFGPESSFQSGDNIILSYNVIVACNLKITLGNNVMIGEYSSLRDTTHNYDVKTPMINAQDISKEIFIGNDVWIGRGCLICEGSYIEDGVVVAAHSVVKGRLLRNGIYGGCPAKIIKFRFTEDDK